MSDAETLGQLFMVGYEGVEPSARTLSLIRTRGVGGFKVFGWNARDTSRLAAALATLQQTALVTGCGIPLLVATDQEGGWIRHVKGATLDTPGNMAIGATGLESDAYRSGLYLGSELAVLGIGMNFAPVVDLATRPGSAIIGPRAFSDDPAKVAALGAAFMEGTLAAGIIPTAKHFPGHGDTLLDSHGTLPQVDIGLDVLRKRELVPFRELVAKGIPAVMGGHLSFPRISGKTESAAMSRLFMTDILRGELGFRGVAVTDDLHMAGAAGSNGGDLELTCREAIEAGNDLVMLSSLPASAEGMWDSLAASMRRDPAFRARVRQAAARVLALKIAFLRPRGKAALVPDPAKVDARLRDPEAMAFFKDLAGRSVTVVSGGSRLPWNPPGSVLVAGPFREFLDAGAAAMPGARTFRFSYNQAKSPNPKELDAFKAALSGCRAAVVCVAGPSGLAFAAAARDAGVGTAIISVLSPAPVAGAAWADIVLAVYSWSEWSMQAGFDVLSGKRKATGRLPVRLEAP